LHGSVGLARENEFLGRRTGLHGRIAGIGTGETASLGDELATEAVESNANAVEKEKLLHADDGVTNG
jgi:hypothetical protein